ncbi:MAG: hypothetical protein J0M12_15940 [Deltaproteobacteria bacterium]|nr:hypothetical protein [Deltaproteobacteria bacterium]
MKKHLLALVLIVAAGCSSMGKKPQYELEVVTVEEQAAQAVNESPTDFIVQVPDETIAWERSQLFFSTYTSGAVQQEFDYPRPGVALVTKSREKDKYIYEIEHSATKDGAYRYVVSCSRNTSKHGGSDYAAQRNARNVARFIRDGNLELSLLDR